MVTTGISLEKDMNGNFKCNLSTSYPRLDSEYHLEIQRHLLVRNLWPVKCQ